MPGPVPLLPLNSRTLPHWRGRLPVPAYDRDVVTPGVVHIGVGGFHRAHQAMYHDRMMNEGTALDWGICGVGVLAADRAMQQALGAQDGLYTLVLKHSDGTYEPRVIGSLVEYLFAPDNPEAVIEKMAKLLYPEKLDIDKMPESPTKQVVDLLKQVAAVARGAAGKP